MISPQEGEWNGRGRLWGGMTKSEGHKGRKGHKEGAKANFRWSFIAGTGEGNAFPYRAGALCGGCALGAMRDGFWVHVLRSLLPRKEKARKKLREVAGALRLRGGGAWRWFTKCNFVSMCVPKCNLGTRSNEVNQPSGLPRSDKLNTRRRCGAINARGRHRRRTSGNGRRFPRRSGDGRRPCRARRHRGNDGANRLHPCRGAGARRVNPGHYARRYRLRSNRRRKKATRRKSPAAPSSFSFFSFSRT